MTSSEQRFTLTVMKKASATNFFSQLEETLDEYFGKKAPALPKEAKELLIKVAPYLAILSAILMLPSLLLLLGLGGLTTMFAPFGGVRAVSMVPTMWVGILLLIPSAVLNIMAIPGLFSRAKIAWTYMYWAQLISLVSSLVQLNIVGAVVGALVGFYILFQVKSFYK